MSDTRNELAPTRKIRALDRIVLDNGQAGKVEATMYSRRAGSDFVRLTGEAGWIPATRVTLAPEIEA